MSPLAGADIIFEDMGTGRENWFDINICDLKKKMRAAYDLQEEEWLGYREWYKNHLKKFSYENVGKLMIEALNEN